MLPEDLRRAAEREAKHAGLSLGELIRQRLRPALEGQKSGVPALFARTPWKGQGPSDLSANHDQYLYGS